MKKRLRDLTWAEFGPLKLAAVAHLRLDDEIELPDPPTGEEHD